jgi:hypothetical protein
LWQGKLYKKVSVEDPDSAHFSRILIRIRIQALDDQKLEKIYSWKKILFFGNKNCNLQEKPSALKREHSALQIQIRNTYAYAYSYLKYQL